MIESEKLQHLQDELRNELLEDILPYWVKHGPDTVNGGFMGRITHDNMQVVDASKGAILNARLLWTFSACYKVFKDEKYHEMARRAYDYILDYFWDRENGGVYWMVDANGRVEEDRKHIYAQSFAIYAFCEYYQAFKEEEALEWAQKLYQLVVEKSADAKQGGYFEAFSRDWKLLDDVRLSEKDINEPKSMNTHLHILEAFTNLYRCWKTDELRERQQKLIDIFLQHIIARDGRSLVTFMDVDWTPRSDEISFGHDIEASWLLLEAAEVIDDQQRIEKVKEASLKLVHAVIEQGVDADGGLFNEANPDGLTDVNKDWWPQAEAVVGFLNAFEHTGNAKFVEAAEKSWDFIKRYVIDKEYGEWLEKVSRDGVASLEDKVRSWKGPYHNARACLEVVNRTGRLLASPKEKVTDTPSHSHH